MPEVGRDTRECSDRRDRKVLSVAQGVVLRRGVGTKGGLSLWDL